MEWGQIICQKIFETAACRPEWNEWWI